MAPLNKQIVIASPSNPQIFSVPYPTLPRPDYVIVRVHAVAINPDDVYHIDLTDDESCAGCYVGCDFAGEIVDVGSDVERGWERGDRVAGLCCGGNRLRKEDGAFGWFAVAKGDLLIRVPEGMRMEEAATLGVAVHTMGQSLYRDLELPLPTKPAKNPLTIFIYGGSTAMGISAIQLATLSGASVITTSSPANSDYIRSLGADHVFDYTSPTLTDDVRTIVGDDLTLAFDTKALPSSAEICARVLSSKGGKYCALLPDIVELVKTLNPRVETFPVLAYTALGETWFYEKEERAAVPEDYEFAKDFVLVCEQLLAEGKLKGPRIFLNRGGDGLEGVLHGIAECREGKVSAGKLVYTIKADEA